MADNIQQWRRMIQPARARTPAAPEHEDADIITLSVTPKRGLKPKFSSYFTNHGPAAGTLRREPSVPVFNDDVFDPEMPTWPADEPFPDPNPEELMDTIMCRLLANPYDALEPRFSGTLLRIFECYRDLRDDNSQLQAQICEELSKCGALEKRLQIASKQWSEERQDFKAEVKRLELLLVKGQRGVAEVTLARQDSLLRQKDANRRSRLEDDGLQTIFEFLERHQQYDEKAWSNQRAVMRVHSPSAQMRRLSQQLMSKKSSTNIHADLPFGTPPDAMRSTLAETSMLETQADTLKTTSETPSSSSDDTFSTFSHHEGALPNAAAALDSPEAGEMQLIHRLAEALARRRRVDLSKVVPKLLEMFDVQMPEPAAEKVTATPSTRHVSRPKPGQTEIDKPAWRSASVSKGQKQGSLMSKASGLFHKLRPHPDIKRFSFEAGDDTTDNSPQDAAENILGQPVLRRSISSSALPQSIDCPRFKANYNSPDQSSAVPLPLLDRRASRIPAPVDCASSVARPRQERDMSSSSMLTLSKRSENASASRSGSVSVCSSQAIGDSSTKQSMLSRAHGYDTTTTAALEPISGNRMLTDLILRNANVEKTHPMARDAYADAAKVDVY